MKSISQKEKDLKLMKTLSPEQFTEYNRLKANISAKTIQNAWRKSPRNPNNIKYSSLYSTTNRKTAIRNAKFFPFRMSKDKKLSEAERKDITLRESHANERFYKEKMKLNETLADSYKRNGVSEPFHPTVTGKKLYQSVFFNRNNEFFLELDFTLDEHGLRMSQLYQRIRGQAAENHSKMKKDLEKAQMNPRNMPGAGEASQGGMRSKYKELLEIQQRTEILQDEYLADKDYLDYRKEERRKSIGTSLELLEMLKNPPSLEEAAKIISYHKNSNLPQAKMDADRKEYVQDWIYNLDSEYVNNYLKKITPKDEKKDQKVAGNVDFQHTSLDDQKKTQLFEKAMENHLLAMDTMINSNRWDSVFVPVTVEDFTDKPGTDNTKNQEEEATEEKKSKEVHFSREMPSVKQLTKPASLRNLANKWSTGVDADDSLYWITYATQPSKVLHREEDRANPFLNKAPPASKTGEEQSVTVTSPNPTMEFIRKQSTNENYKTMLKEFHLNLINPQKRLNASLHKINKENQKISELSENIQKQFWKDIKYKYFEEFQASSKRDRLNRKMKTIIFIQSRIRGFLQRMRYRKLKKQQRFYLAIQNLLHEAEVMNDDRKPLHARKSNRSTDFSTPASLNSKSNQKSVLKSSYDRNIEEIARIASAALKTPLPSTNYKPSAGGGGGGVTNNRSAALPAIDLKTIPKDSTTLANPLFSQSIDYSKLTAGKRIDPSSSSAVNNNNNSSSNATVNNSLVSTTPGKYDQMTMKTPYVHNLDLLPETSSSSRPPLMAGVKPGETTYNLRRVDDPMNQQLSARGYHLQNNAPLGGGISSTGPGGSGYDTPILQTPRGLFPVSQTNTEEKKREPSSSSSSIAMPSTPVNPAKQQQQQQQSHHSLEKEEEEVVEPRRPAGLPTSQRKRSDEKRFKQEQEISTPVKNNNAADTSSLLSPFLGMNEEDPNSNTQETLGGYISSPSQTSLSRSLSVSFGQVTNKEFSPRAEQFQQHQQQQQMRRRTPTTVPFISNDFLPVFFQVEKNYDMAAFDAKDIVKSALAADISNFDKKGAIEFTIGLLKKVPPKSIIQWLSQYPFQRTLNNNNNANSNTPSGRRKVHSELPVDLVALLLSELARHDNKSNVFIRFLIIFLGCSSFSFF
jgi:hypothetical protein